MKPEKKQEFLDNYSKNNFHIGNTCKQIGISRDLFYQWKKLYPDFKEAVEKFEDFVLEMAEDVAIQALEEGDKEMARFVLKSLGKRKGYGDKLDITSNGESINTIKLIEIKKQDGTTD